MTTYITGGPPRYAHQKRGLKRAIQTQGNLALLMDPGTGKGMPLNGRVLTPTGWVCNGDLVLGDLVVGSDGRPTRVTGIYDRGELPVYRVEFTDDSSVVVDGDHLWQVTYRTKKGETHTTVRDTRSLLDVKKLSRYYIPTTRVQHPEVDLPLDPYALGALIADGFLGRSVAWSKSEPSVIERMQRTGLSMRETTVQGEVRRFSVSGLTKILDGLGLRVSSAEKRIPETYFISSVDQRIALVHGLFDGDGSVRRDRGTARYCTSSEGLARDVQALLWSLGVGASRERVKSSKGDWWYVHVHGDFNPFESSPYRDEVTGTSRTHRRSIRSITPAGTDTVRCIRVESEDSLYVVEDYIVTHNTAVTLDYIGLLALKSPRREARVLVVAPYAAVDTWVKQAPALLSPQVSVWAEVLGGTNVQKVEALAARGDAPYSKPVSPKTKTESYSRSLLPVPRALHHSKAWTIQTRNGNGEIEHSLGPAGLGDELPRVIIEVVNFEAMSRQRDKVPGSHKSVGDAYADAVERFDPDLLVVDESHKAKSPGGAGSQMLSRIARRVPRRMLLSGTIMPHSPMDVFSQWRILDPYAFGKIDPRTGKRKPATYGGFKAEYAQLGGFMGREIVGFRNLDRMQDVMARNSFVVKKEDALDLPMTTDVIHDVRLTAREARAYQQMKTELSASLGTGETTLAMSRLTQRIRLRQITSGHLPNEDGDIVILGDSKVKTIASIVNDELADEKRVVVFSYFTPEIHALSEALAVAGTEVMTVTGDTPQRDRMAYRERFGSNAPKRIVIVAQSRTMAVSVNELVTANHAVFGSLSEQRDDLIQARDRLNRIGQTRPVTFHYALAPGTVDTVIYQTMKDRTDLEGAMLAHIKS